MQSSLASGPSSSHLFHCDSHIQERCRKKYSGAAEETGLLMPETLWAVPTGLPPPLPLVAKKVRSRLGEGKWQAVF